MNTTSGDLTTTEEAVGIDIYSYLEMKVHDFLFLYISPVIILFGTLGNILSLVVLQSRHYKSSPTSIALSALALTDIGFLTTGPLRHWIRLVSGIDVRLFANISCKINFGLTYLTHCLSVNILGLTTFERFLCVWFPLKVGKWITKRRMLIAIIMVNIVYLLCHIPLFVDININTSGSCDYSSRKFAIIWHWANLIMYVLIPFITIFICNVFICDKPEDEIQPRRQENQFHHSDVSCSRSSIPAFSKSLWYHGCWVLI